MIHKINNELLISAYKKARALKLDSYFIFLLLNFRIDKCAINSSSCSCRCHSSTIIDT